MLVRTGDSKVAFRIAIYTKGSDGYPFDHPDLPPGISHLPQGTVARSEPVASSSISMVDEKSTLPTRHDRWRYRLDRAVSIALADAGNTLIRRGILARRTRSLGVPQARLVMRLGFALNRAAIWFIRGPIRSSQCSERRLTETTHNRHAGPP